MRQYVVDAFADRIFEGNPAAVCVMERWPEEDLMLKITRENNLSETAFVVKEGEEYRLRWFTPGGEIDLCGHATLAAAHIITRFVEPGVERVGFQTLSGLLTVRAEGELLSMDFPAYQLKRLEVTEEITQALGARPSEVWRARDLLCVFDRAEDVLALKPDMDKLLKVKGALMQVTAPGWRGTTASPARLPQRWGCRRILCAAPDTAISSPTGRKSWARPGSWPAGIPQRGTRTAGWKGTGSFWRAGRCSMPGPS